MSDVVITIEKIVFQALFRYVMTCKIRLALFVIADGNAKAYFYERGRFKRDAMMFQTVDKSFLAATPALERAIT